MILKKFYEENFVNGVVVLLSFSIFRIFYVYFLFVLHKMYQKEFYAHKWKWNMVEFFERVICGFFAFFFWIEIYWQCVQFHKDWMDVFYDFVMRLRVCSLSEDLSISNVLYLILKIMFYTIYKLSSNEVFRIFMFME